MEDSSAEAKFYRVCLSTWSTDSSAEIENLNFMAKEFIYMVGYFLEIEYGVLSDVLVRVWQMILTCLTLATSSEDVSADLGCRVLLYSELHQAHNGLLTGFP